MFLTNGVLSPNLLQNVILTVFLCPVRWSKVWQVWKGGLYRCKLAAHSVWLTFSTRCRPMESIGTDTNTNTFLQGMLLECYEMKWGSEVVTSTAVTSSWTQTSHQSSADIVKTHSQQRFEERPEYSSLYSWNCLVTPVRPIWYYITAMTKLFGRTLHKRNMTHILYNSTQSSEIRHQHHISCGTEHGKDVCALVLSCVHSNRTMWVYHVLGRVTHCTTCKYTDIKSSDSW